MASMQVLGGSPSANAAAGPSGAVDPLMAGFSAEAVAAAAGQAGSGTPENQFAGEFAAALAALEAQQAAAMAQSLGSQALLEGQNTPDAALLAANGQNFPFDPAFQSAVLATFAAVNGAVQADTAADSMALIATDSAALQAAAGEQLAVDPLAITQEVANPEALAAQLADEQSADADQQSQASLQVTPAVEVATQAFNAPVTTVTPASGSTETGTAIEGTQSIAQTTAQTAVQAPVAEAAQAQAKAKAQAKGAEVSSAQNNVSDAGNGQTAAVGQGVVKSVSQTPSDQSNTSADHGLQQQAPDAAALADAAAPKARAAAAEQSSKETTLAGNLAGDAGNVVVTVKANAEGVAAAADTARQSAQRVDATAGNGASQAMESAARAESKLEATRASLGSGPLNVEVLKLTKQGGGRAVLEVTPPNQGPIRLDLQLDGAGRATLLVEGLTEAMKARLESSSHFLRQDMAQMGLALNLEMRERNDSNPAPQAFDQGQFGQSGGKGGRDSGGKSTAATTASGNTPGARGSVTADDGIHLVA